MLVLLQHDPFSLLLNKDPRPIQASKSSILILLLKLTQHSNTKNLQLKAGFSDEQNLNPRDEEDQDFKGQFDLRWRLAIMVKLEPNACG
ncbi:uncharacterized protein LOC112007245 isoform X4 [Quercus suber]|uniref:uncharacterized protein LOC112007245 isoform X4 n=1 Tax=Quercus suber TaxID=58331 RepID=UPI0032DE9DB0